MEKRAIVAFVLSLLVLVFWEYYFGLFRSTENPPMQQQQPAEVAPPQEKSQPSPNLPLGSLPPQALPNDRLALIEKQFQNWSIDSPLYKMQIVAPGARISSFELEKFRQSLEPNSDPMQLVPSRTTGYLPLAVDLLQHQDWQLSTQPFTSAAPEQLNITPEMEKKTLSFISEVPGKVRITKNYTFTPGTYIVDTQVQLQNLSQDTLIDQMGISFYFQPYSTGAESSYNVSQLTSYSAGTLSTFPSKDLLKKEVILKAPMDWLGYENNYFIQAIMPIDEKDYQIVPRVLDADKNLLQVVFLSEPFQLPANQEKTVKLRLYMGPKELGDLEKAEHNLVKAVDYGWFTFLAKPLLLVLKGFYKFTHNYGIAIILLTVLIKIFFWPLTQKSFKSMQNMKKIQPRIAQIREKYKDDKEKLNQELLGLYRTYKVNPLGGCLPMVLQIPVFFALYRMLNGAVELRHQPFMLWINDLTAPDRLYIGFPIPYLEGIPVLTILMGVSMFVQQKMTPSAGDPRQEQIMLLMPVVFTVMFINFPSGLVLYWLVNNVLSIVQQYWVNRSSE